MTANFKPVAFEPYGRSRSGFRVPRWLLLLLLGAASGAAAVLYVQEQVLPPRLSAAESSELRNRLTQLEADGARLKADLAATNQQLQSTQGERSTLANDLAADRERTKNSRADFDFLVASLPADPRGGLVEVRAARLVRQRGALAYEVLLTRGKNAPAQVAGVMQFVVTGLTNGVERHLTLEPIKVNVGAHQPIRGSLQLPEAFTPKQTTVNVLDQAGGKLLGMRVLYVQG